MVVNPDYECPADDKVPLAELDVKPGDRIDCYVYGYLPGEYPDWAELQCNIEIEFGPNMEIVAVLDTGDVLRRENQRRQA